MSDFASPTARLPLGVRPLPRSAGAASEELASVALGNAHPLAARRAHDAAAVAARIGRAMGLSDADVRFVHYAALVHGQPFAEAPGLAPLRETLRHVPEHFDGTGGPDRLAGHAIPLASRIVRVATEYIRCRPGDGVAPLREHAGTRLDPAVVDALAGVLRAHVA